jgi:hypothetical protein
MEMISRAWPVVYPATADRVGLLGRVAPDVGMFYANLKDLEHSGRMAAKPAGCVPPADLSALMKLIRDACHQNVLPLLSKLPRDKSTPTPNAKRRLKRWVNRASREWSPCAARRRFGQRRGYRLSPVLASSPWRRLLIGLVTYAGASRRAGRSGKAEKWVSARHARLGRPDEPAEPMARRRDRRANPFGPFRKPHFSGELRILVNERAAGCGRAPFGARQDRHADSIAGRDRQEMGEDGGLFAVGRFVTMIR